MKAAKLLLLWTVAVAATATSCVAATPFLWRADGASLTRVDLGTGEARSVRLDTSVDAVEPDESGGAWVRSGSTIARINTETRVTASYQFDPASPPAGSLVWDAPSSVLWAAAGSQVYRFDEQLKVQSVWRLDRNISDLAVAGPVAIWVATGDAVARFDAHGHLLQHTNVPDAAARMSRLLIDRQDGSLWVLTTEHFIAFDAFSSSSLQRRLDATSNWQSVMLDEHSGDLIVRTSAGFTQITSGGLTSAPSATATVTGSNVGVVTFGTRAPRAITTDFASGPLVFSGEIPDAMRPATVVPRQRLAPEIANVRGEIVPGSGLRFILQPRALCNGEECPRSARYLSNLRPSVTLDGEPVEGTYRYLGETGEILLDVRADTAGGVHVAEIFVEDPYGNRSAAIQLSIDPAAVAIHESPRPKTNALPTVALTAPPGNASFAAPANIIISATAADTDGTISKVEFYRDGTLLATDPTSPYSYNWNNVAIGSYVLTARAYDNAGGIATSAPRTVQVKANVAPAVTLTSPVNNASFTAPATVNLAAAATDTDGAITKVEFYNGASKLTTISGSPYTYAWTNVAGGNYTLTAKATDDKGAVTTSAASAISVNRAPTVTLTAPANGTLLAAPANINLAATASDPDGTISKVDFYNGATRLATDTTSPYSFTWTNVGIGTYALTAIATDNKGATTTSNAVTVTVGTNKPPAVTLTSPATGATIKEVATIALAATASDLDGTVAKVEFFNGSTLLGSDTASPYAYSWKNVYQGTYAITAKATDDKGAATVSAPVTVVVQPNVYPIVTLTAPVDGVEVLGDTPSTVQLKATASDPDGTVTKVQFLVDQSLINPGPGRAVVATLSQPPYVASWTPSIFPVTSTPCFWAEATDNGGFVTASNYACVPFSLDTMPTTSLAEPGPIDFGGAATANFLAPATIVLVAHATDFDSGFTSDKVAKVEFLDGTTVLAAITAPNGSDGEFVWVWRNAPVGSHSIAIRATDTLGKTSDASMSVPALINVYSAIPPPIVVLTQPTSGQRYLTDAAVPLAASVAGGGAAITRVDFVVPGAIVGSATAPPFAANWVNPPEGTHAITARAFDNFGNVTASRATFVTVGRDSQVPLLVLTSPTALNTYPAGAPITVSADVVDPYRQVQHVDFYAGPILIGSATAPPYTVPWANPPAGVVSLSAIAKYDSLGSKASSSITIRIVSGNAPPTVSLSAPANGATYVAPATINLAAVASDTDGTIAKVEFFAGSTLIGTRTAAPYAATWSGVVSGTYTLTARATDNKGAIVISSPVIVTVQAPAGVAIAAPAAGARFSSGQSIPITINANMPGHGIDRIEFYADGMLLISSPMGGAVTTATATLNWSGATIGSHALGAKVIATDGSSLAAANVAITVADLSLGMIEPYPEQVYLAPGAVRIAANPTESGVVIARVDFYGDGVLLGHKTGEPFTWLWTGVAAGPHSVMAIAYDALGATATLPSVPINIVALPSIQVDPGFDGATVADDNVNLTGSVQAPANSAVIVNGRLAGLGRDGRFFANNVRLVPGSNSITITLNSQDASPVTKTIALTSSGRKPFEFTLDPPEGLSPLTSNVWIVNRDNVPFKKITLQTEGLVGPGITLTSLVEGEPTLWTPPVEPGVYTLVLTAFDANDAVIHTAKVEAHVVAREDLAWRVVGVYRSMVDRLAAGDATGAARLFVGDSQARYLNVFATLATTLPSVAAQLGTLVDGVVSEAWAELTLARALPAGRQLFMIYLIRGGDGIWRIESM